MIRAKRNDREVLVQVWKNPTGFHDVDALSAWAAMSLARELAAEAQAAATDWVPCESCGTPMVFAVTEAGKRMPLEVGDHLLGNQAARWDAGTLRVRSITQARPGLEEGEHRVMSHYATCVKADRWRRPGPSRAPAARSQRAGAQG